MTGNYYVLVFWRNLLSCCNNSQMAAKCLRQRLHDRTQYIDSNFHPTKHLLSKYCKTSNKELLSSFSYLVNDGRVYCMKGGWVAIVDRSIWSAVRLGGGDQPQISRWSGRSWFDSYWYLTISPRLPILGSVWRDGLRGFGLRAIADRVNQWKYIIPYNTIHYVCVYVVCMYVCMYVYIHTRMYYVCVYVCVYACVYVCMYVCMYVCILVCMYTCMYTCMYVYYVCMYAYMDACMHACIKGSRAGKQERKQKSKKERKKEPRRQVKNKTYPLLLRCIITGTVIPRYSVLL